MPAPTAIDVDGHVFEPDELWEEHLPAAFHDRRPRLVRDDRGTTRYQLDGHLIPVGTGRGAWVPEGIMEASAQRDGATDPHARLADMDTEGIAVAVLYGAMSLGLYALRDLDLSIACCRAYNDWLAKYCSADPGRLKGTPALPLRSIPDALDEARRCVEDLGFVSLTVPCAVGERNPDDPENDPLYALAEELDVPIGFHAGGTRFAYGRFVDSYATLHALEFPYDIMFAAATIVCGGVLERFSHLRVLLLEAGSAWGPYMFERFDEHWEKRPTEMPLLTKAPSAYLDDGRLVVSSSRARASSTCRTRSSGSVASRSCSPPTTRTGTRSSPSPSAGSRTAPTSRTRTSARCSRRTRGACTAGVRAPERGTAPCRRRCACRCRARWCCTTR